MSGWTLSGKPFSVEYEDLEEYVGFVYIVTERGTNMKYIGKKLFHRTKTLPVTKTRKRKKKTLVESDWRTYCGSSEKVKEILSVRGLDGFRREILHLCRTKGECSYLEAKEQFDRNVLLRDDYYNGIINCRINRKHLKMPTINGLYLDE